MTKFEEREKIIAERKIHRANSLNYAYFLQNTDGNPFPVGIFRDLKTLTKYLKDSNIQIENKSEDEIIDFCNGISWKITKCAFFRNNFAEWNFERDF